MLRTTPDTTINRGRADKVQMTFDSGLQRLRKCGKGESYEVQP